MTLETDDSVLENPEGTEVVGVREGSGYDWNHKGFGTGRPVSARNVIRQLERRYGDRKEELRIDWRRKGDFVEVFEVCKMRLVSVCPGMGMLVDVHIPITCIDEFYGINDVLRNRRNFQGESSREAIAKADETAKAEAKSREEAVRHEAEQDWERMSKGRRQVWQGGPSGGF